MNKALLKDISKHISSGLTPLRSNPIFWESQDIPWVKTEQLGIKHIYNSNEKISKTALEKTSLKLNPVNSLSIAMYGEGQTRGRISIFKSEMTTNQACCNLVIDEDKAHYEYVYYFLKTQYQELRNLSSGVRKNLNSNDIKSFEIRLPEELNTQISIAKALANLDKKIELNNKINTELEAMAKLIYDYWFVQFDFPDANGKPYKSSGGKMVYNEELKREIPEGWSDKELSDIAEIKAGGDKPKILSAEISENRTVPIYSNGIKNYGLYGYTEAAKISSPSITISARGTIGVSFLRMKPFVPIIRLIVVTPNNQNYLKYLDECLSTTAFENSGSVQKQLTAPQISRLKIICPTDELLEKYTSMVFPSISEIEIIKDQNNELTKLRDWLLPMLMNGQVTIKES